MNSRIAAKILLFTIISLLICNQQVYSAHPKLRAKSPTHPRLKSKIAIRPKIRIKKKIPAKSLIEQISICINSNDTEKAISLLNKAVLKDPYNPKLFSMAANLFYKNSQYSEAEMLARRAISLNPKDNSCYLILGNVLIINYKTNRQYNESPTTDQDISLLNESLKCFNAVYDNDPTSALPHIGMAKVYYLQNNKDKAYDELLKAKELCGNDSESLFELGTLLSENGYYEKAIKYLNKSISTGSKNNYKAHSLLAQIYEKLGSFEDAQNEYISTLNPNSASPVIRPRNPNLVVLPTLDTNTITSSRPQNSNNEIPVNNNNINSLDADNLLVQDRLSEARESYLKILKQNPTDVDAISGLSEIYYAQWLAGYYDTKKYFFDKDYFDNLPPNESKIPLIKFRLISEPKMNEAMEDALCQVANNQSSDFNDRFDAARAMFLLGNYITARIKLQELMTANITDYDKLKMATLLYLDQNYPEAEELIDTIQKTDYSDYVKTIKDRILVRQSQSNEAFNKAFKLYKDEKYKEAILSFEEEFKIAPADKKSHLYYAYTLQRTGNIDKAIEELNIYMNLELIYPSKKPELKLSDIQKLTKSWQKTTK